MNESLGVFFFFFDSSHFQIVSAESCDGAGRLLWLAVSRTKGPFVIANVEIFVGRFSNF